VRRRFGEAELTSPHVRMGISDDRPGNLALFSTRVGGGAPEWGSGEVGVRCALRGAWLLTRVYQLWSSVRGEQAFGDLSDCQPVGTFRITDAPGKGPVAVAHAATDGPVHIQHGWEVRACR